LPSGPGGSEAWGDVTSFRFENLYDPSDLPSGGCPEGPDCPADLRFASGDHRLQVRARTEDGRELDEALGELQFEINYPPSAWIVHDPGTGVEDPAASPVASWFLSDGSVRRVALAEGDTIPSGSSLRVRVGGRDRLRGTSETDSFCCDLRLDSSNPEVVFQGQANFVRENVRGFRDSLFTFVGETSTDSVFAMTLGPFDYSARFRALDEHERRGEFAALDFVVGYPPRLPETTIEDGALILLHPERDPASGEGEFVRGEAATLKWDPALQDWSEISGETTLDGVWYEIPLRFRGGPDPRVTDVSVNAPPDAGPEARGYSDHVRSFAYELVHEHDPLNVIKNGPGDFYDRFIDADTIGSLDLEGSRAWRLFIPDLFFVAPELFDPPSGDCPEELTNYCAIGFWLRERLGQIELRVRSRTTGSDSVFDPLPPGPARKAPLSLADAGRFSPVLEKTFALRLALTDETGQLIGVWPPESP
jgi:hypothetical protein